MAGGKIFRSRLRGRTASAVTSDEASGFERASWGTVRLLITTERPFQLSLQVLHQLKGPLSCDWPRGDHN